MTDVLRYAQRRASLAERMGEGIAIVPTAAAKLRNRDSEYPYRYDSYFHYLCGFPEPEAVLVVIAGARPQSLLFCREKNAERETWDGYRYGPDAAREAYGLDAAHPIAALDAILPQLMANQPTLHYAPGADCAWDARILGWLNQVRAQARTGVGAPQRIYDVRTVLDEMRVIKGEDELALMRKAAQISAQAHVRAMRATCPGKMEYEIEAELLYGFRRLGAQFPAYWPIVAGGSNACVLHYSENSARLEAGTLLLIDAGCELDGYAADITRTFPVDGRFSGAQKAVYELVLAAQAAAISAVGPNANWDAPHAAAVRVLAQGMIDLKLCQGSLDKVIEGGDYKRYFMHRTGHWLGMDVHDVGEYKRDGAWRKLEPGMTLTVEPGCYIPAAEDVAREFWNIGVRIEDDVVVTAAGCEVLTNSTPKQIAELEQIVGHSAS